MDGEVGQPGFTAVTVPCDGCLAHPSLLSLEAYWDRWILPFSTALTRASSASRCGQPGLG